MKILLTTDQLEGGGAERQLVLLASGLEAKGHTSTLLSFYNNDDFYRQMIKDAGIDHIHKPAGKNPLVRIGIIRKIARELNVDAVIAFKNGTAMAAATAGIGAKWTTIVSERNHTLKLTLREKLKFRLYRFADAVVCNSNAQENMISFNFPELRHKTSVIHNFPPSFPAFTPMKKGPERYVLTVGRISPQKNMEFYFHLVRRCLDEGLEAKFRWVGNAVNKDYLNRMMSLRKKLNLESHVEILPATADIVRYYEEASHFLLPSLHEGFSNALCEAVEAGLTCIASDAGDNVLILGNKNLVFSPDNLEEAVEKLRNALLHPYSDNPTMISMVRANMHRLTNTGHILQSWLSLISSRSACPKEPKISMKFW